MSSAYFRHFWNYILLEVTALILIPAPQHISALTPFWFIYTVYYQSPIQSIKAGIQTHAHVWIMHTNTHQGTGDNCYGLDHSSNTWQPIGKGGSEPWIFIPWLLLDPSGCLATGNQMNGNSIRNSMEEAWPRDLCISYPKPLELYSWAFWADSSFISSCTHRNSRKTPATHTRQSCQANAANRTVYRELEPKGKPRHKPQLQPGLGIKPT